MNILELLFNIFNFFPNMPQPTNFMLSFNLAMIINAGAILIIKRILRVNYIQTLVIYKDISQRIGYYKFDGTKLKITKDWMPKLDSKAIMPPHKAVTDKFKIWGKKQDDLVIAIEGSEDCLTLRGLIDSEGKISDKIDDSLRSVILQLYSKTEVQKWLRKVLTLQLAERKLFKDSYFFIFLMVMGIILMFQIMIAQRLGII